MRWMVIVGFAMVIFLLTYMSTKEIGKAAFLGALTAMLTFVAPYIIEHVGSYVDVGNTESEQYEALTTVVGNLEELAEQCEETTSSSNIEEIQSEEVNDSETEVKEKKKEIKKSEDEYIEGWMCTSSEVEWNEWKYTSYPYGAINTDTYQVELVKSAVTKTEYLYYNWWYYNENNVKIFSTDNNGGTIPDSQYWEKWYDYTMESKGWIEKFDVGDDAKYWENPVDHDVRYLGGERETVVEEALYMERFGYIMYTHEREVYE